MCLWGWVGAEAQAPRNRKGLGKSGGGGGEALSELDCLAGRNLASVDATEPWPYLFLAAASFWAAAVFLLCLFQRATWIMSISPMR